jgi:GntR family transcriptional regulator, arabinose operon transcriptional repressor
LSCADQILYYQLVTSTTVEGGAKYKRIYRALHSAIASGEYRPGQRLPSESDLLKMFDASRITISRALRELQLGGIIDRRAGSGSYVRPEVRRAYKFGLLIPDLGQTEIFEPICRGMAMAKNAQKFDLIWGKTLIGEETRRKEAMEACRWLIARRISGVFFAPLEANPQKDELNTAITSELAEAQVPTVLLDRDIVDYPNRSRFDVVSIDNRRAGFVATRHLLDMGCRRIVFIGRPHLAPSCVSRSAGYRDALLNGGAALGPGVVVRLDPSDGGAVLPVLQQHAPDGVVCSNDRTAAQLLRTLADLAFPVPERIRLVAFDDVKYASLVSVPLTTIHQPCEQLGAAAVQAMIQRIESPNVPAGDFLVDFKLVIRESSGAPVGAPIEESELAIAE